MAEVEWIKIKTDMFDNRKIKHLRTLPEGNNIVLIWVMLLTMAGRCNARGMIFLTENIPYTTKMLADELNFKENTVKLALGALEQFNMIETNEDFVTITGWLEHQNAEGLDRIREQTRQRVAKHRAKKKALPSSDGVTQSNDIGNVTSNVTVTQSNATEREREKELEGDIEKEQELESESIEHPPTPAPFGKYQNVVLSDEELERLKAEYPDYQSKIERLSEYMKSTGKTYDSHYATICIWAQQDAEKETSNKGRTEMIPSWMHKPNAFNNYQQRDCDYGELENQMVKASMVDGPKTAGNDEGVRARAEELKNQILGKEPEADG